MTTRIVLDTAGLEAWSRRRPPDQLIAVMEVARAARSSRVVVPSVVLVEALTGSRSDAGIDRRLGAVLVEDHLPVPRARRAASLRQGTDASAVDAVVAEAAHRHAAHCVVTSDPGDLSTLLERAGGDTVVIAV